MKIRKYSNIRDARERILELFDIDKEQSDLFIEFLENKGYFEQISGDCENNYAFYDYENKDYYQEFLDGLQMTN